MSEQSETEALEIRRLEAELKARDDFFSAVAHELRNPLNALHLTLVGLLRAESGKSPLPPDQIIARLNRASVQVTKLAKMVDDMLDVSRISGKRLQLTIEEFDAAAALKEVIARLTDAASPQQITVSMPPALTMRSDRARFVQIASNLLTNAILYGKGNPIEVLLTGDDSRARLEVVDHGIGIAEADQERIFHRFERLAKDVTSNAFGLGLWVAREAARALHGDVSVVSKPGEGSTFIVELPKLDVGSSTGPT